MKKLTRDEVKAILRPLGLTISKRDGEYRVAYTSIASPHERQSIEGSAYYTTDLQDALDTGREMARHTASAKQLADATILRAKRNPRRRSSPRYTPREVFAQAERGTDQAYKGYHILFNALRSEYYVSKGGHHIGTYQRISDAKRDIDLIATPDRNPRKRKMLTRDKRGRITTTHKARKRNPSAAPLVLWIIKGRRDPARPWHTFAVAKTKQYADLVRKALNRAGFYVGVEERRT